MKEKTAKIIRIITIPPIEALAMLLILYRLKQEESADGGIISDRYTNLLISNRIQKKGRTGYA